MGKTVAHTLEHPCVQSQFPLGRALLAHSALHSAPGWSGPAARAMLDQGTHQERHAGLTSCQGKPNSPWSTGIWPGEDRIPGQPKSSVPVRVPTPQSCWKQPCSAPDFSPWLSEHWEEHCEAPSAAGLLPSCSSTLPTR